MRLSLTRVLRGRLGALAATLVLALVVLVAVPAVQSARADDLDDRRAAAEAQQEAAAAAREQTEASLEDVGGELQASAAALLEVQSRIPAAQATLDAAEVRLETAQREATIIAARLQDTQTQQAALEGTISTDTARSAELRAAIGELARDAYRTGATSSSLEVILGAESIEDFAQRYGQVSTALRTQSEVLDELNAADAKNRNAQARLTAVADAIADLKAQAEAQVAEADAARAEAEDARAELDRLQREEQQRQAQLAAQQQDLESQLAAQDAAEQQLASDIADLIAQQRARDATISSPSGSVSGALFTNPTNVSPMYVTSEYGMRYHPLLHYTRLHAGIDLRTYCNTPEYAGRSGTVQWARFRSGFGNQVMIDHGYVDGNSLMSSYNHMTSFVVSAGQRVEAGQLIGYSGNTGTSGGCHLHFEVYVNGATVNPRPLLGL